MIGNAFNRYLIQRTRDEHVSWLPENDPTVEFYDGTVRVHDQRGESCSLKAPMPRQLRALATQLLLVADEIERRAHEER